MQSLSPRIVLETLQKEYGTVRCTLDWTTPLELLVATILAAQCTDARVNIVTKTLFQKYRSVHDYANVTQEELEHDIHSCGTYHMKAKAIQESAKRIIDEYDGNVPQTMKEMLTLRGVGRKTASIVLAEAFGAIEGIPIDTHCMRLTKRMGLTTSKNQATIEREMMKGIERKDWILFSHYLVAHGRACCTARSPHCIQCPLQKNCPKRGIASVKKTRKKHEISASEYNSSKQERKKLAL